MSPIDCRRRLEPGLALVASLAVVACTPSPPPLVDGPGALICPDAPELGPVAVGGEATRQVGCEVGARVGLEITGVHVAPPFSATAPDGVWRPGGTLPIAVTFAPTAPGTFEAEVTVGYRVGGNGGAEATFRVRGEAVGDVPWAPEPEVPACRADGPAPLLDRALELVGLDRETFTMADLTDHPALDDPFRLSWFPALRAESHRAGCFEGRVAGVLDRYLASPHPVSGAIRHAAALLDRAIEGPAMKGDATLLDFARAVERLCTGPAGPCGPAVGEVPEDLGAALAPVLAAISDGLTARAKLVAGDTSGRTPSFWYRSGGNHILGGIGAPSPEREGDLRYLLGEPGRRGLYGEAARIAYAVESIDRTAFAGRTGVRYDLETAAGWIRIRDAAPDAYDDDGTATLLLVDLGGDDVHRDPAGANRDEKNPVSVLLDLGGNDHYGYEVVADPDDRQGLLPSDAEGRYSGTAGRAGATRSTRSRQGAARNGIALLFDFGDGDDRYESLSGSQGYAHLGVGVLFDEGGNDVYLAEEASQGAGVFGIGLLLDAGPGNDERRAVTFSQGFGFVGGAGFLADGGGNDLYFCDPGSAGGGLDVYPSPQMTTDGNNSFCQGAGFGINGSLSGGLGLLRDRAGDDRYVASVFAQGTGYWQGTGLLSDGDGADRYQAFWYVQGAAAHAAVGILADAGEGDDVFDEDFPTRNMSLGAGHDFSLGVFISGGGNDTYHLGTLSAGASNCNGVGLFVDNAGNDRYLAFSDYGSGMGNVSGECIGETAELPSIGVMIDGGGTDTYEYPESSFPVPADGCTWGHARSGLPSEYGAGLDGEGETGIHPESEVR